MFLGATEIESEIIARSSLFELLPGRIVRTCSAEDLVILKALACRAIDLYDIEGVLLRQRGRLDWERIDRELSTLAEIRDDTDVVGELRRIRTRVEALAGP